MAIHGKYISDESKRIRVVRDSNGDLIRVFLHEEWHSCFSRLYEVAKLLVAGVSIDKIPARLDSCFDWLSELTIQTGVYGWMFTFSLVGWIVHLVKKQISLGKFMYESVGLGERFGEALGGGTRIIELPVEG